MVRRLRTALVLMHLATGFGWLSATAVVLLLAVDGERSAALRVDDLLLADLSFMTVYTGTMLAGLSGWGFTRHRWLLVKLGTGIGAARCYRSCSPSPAPSPTSSGGHDRGADHRGVGLARADEARRTADRRRSTAGHASGLVPGRAGDTGRGLRHRPALAGSPGSGGADPQRSSVIQSDAHILGQASGRPSMVTASRRCTASSCTPHQPR